MIIRDSKLKSETPATADMGIGANMATNAAEQVIATISRAVLLDNYAINYIKLAGMRYPPPPGSTAD